MMNLTDKEVRTMVAVFDEIVKMPYEKQNSFLGSITIEEMNRLYWKGRKKLGLDEYEEEV